MIQVFPVIFGSSVLASYFFDLLLGTWAATHQIYILNQAHDIFALLVMSVFVSLTPLLLYSRKELSTGQLYWRYFLILVAVFASVIPIAAMRVWIRFSVPASVAILVGIVLIIYFIIVATERRELRELTDQLNRELKERYERQA